MTTNKLKLSSVEFLGIELDYNNVCRPAKNQINALIRLRILSNFIYWPLLWMFSTSKSLNKIQPIHKITLRFFY